MTGRSILYAGLALAAVSCAAPKAESPGAATPQLAASAPTCPAGGAIMAKTELYFGLAIPGGSTVSDTQWAAFLNTEVTPRFPDGLTIDDVAGQWRNLVTAKTVRERSRVIMVLYQASAEAEKAIEAIRAAYKARFRQDSVMRLDETNCVAI